ncbi:hypothetical protein [Litorimonas haliclonae]
MKRSIRDGELDEAPEQITNKALLSFRTQRSGDAEGREIAS